MSDQLSEVVQDSALVNEITPGSRFSAVLATSKLRNVLRLNAAFSLLTGLDGLLFAGWLADFLGLDADMTVWVRLVAGGLVGFAALVWFEAGGPARRMLPMAGLIAVGDLLWVAATIVIIALGVFSTDGAVLAGLVALIVAEFGMMQLRHRRRARQATAAAGWTADDLDTLEAVRIDKTVAVDADSLWPVMIDHELYAKLAANLGGAVAVTENGPGLVRECRDTRGRSWSESCTLWDPGRRFAISVETGAPDYPYPLDALEGSWGVEPAGSSRSDLTLAFAFRPRPGLPGRGFATAMQAAFRPILRRIVRGWTTAAG